MRTERLVELLQHDVHEAVELLRSVDDYGIRLTMGGEWCHRVDRLLAKYPQHNGAAHAADGDSE
jgi:hypothetical protein